jgi:hypothetical protein
MGQLERHVAASAVDQPELRAAALATDPLERHAAALAVGLPELRGPARC